MNDVAPAPKRHAAAASPSERRRFKQKRARKHVKKELQRRAVREARFER